MNSRRQTSDGGEGRESRAGVHADVLSLSPLFFLRLLHFFFGRQQEHATGGTVICVVGQYRVP